MNTRINTMFFVVLFLAPTAWGQDPGFDAHGFVLSSVQANVRDGLLIRRPTLALQGDYYLAAVGEYAKSSLVLTEQPDDQSPPVSTAIVDNLIAVNTAFGVTVIDRVGLHANVPVFAFATRRDSTVSPGIGNISLTSTINLLEAPTEGSGVGFGLISSLMLPTASDAFLGWSGVGGEAGVAITGELDSLTLSSQVMGSFVPRGVEQLNLVGRDALSAKFGVGYVASETVGLHLETSVAVPIEGAIAEGPKGVPGELLASMRTVTESGGIFTFGAALGLSQSVGTPTARAFVGGGFGKLKPRAEPDSDHLAMFETTDQCPLEYEVVNGWRDQDGCADELGALNVAVTFEGQPMEAKAILTGPEGNRELLIAASGAAMDAIPGSAWHVKATAPCLSGEGRVVVGEQGGRLVVQMLRKTDSNVLVEVVDENDAPVVDATVVWSSERPQCVPGEQSQVSSQGTLEQALGAGAHSITVTAPGFTVHEQAVEVATGDEQTIRVVLGATRIKVEKTQIKILEKVQFETAKAIIKSESFPLLNEVALVIATNPSIGKVEVSGHTDSRGSDSYNQKLSESRAKSVRAFLVERGVSPERLVAVGYGETLPVDTNRTEQGREANRRVEFKLLKSEESP